MPSRNIVKDHVALSYYHVYARGINKQPIFLDSKDRIVFLALFKRYLSKDQQFDNYKSPYPNLYNELELLCFCLMSNHFHLLIYQNTSDAMQRFMRCLLTSYSTYFNRKYSRRGPLFESRYKASFIYSQSYLQHISRYIHLNPSDWQLYEYSSLPYYLGRSSAEWLRPERIVELFDSSKEYAKFLADYEDYRDSLNLIKQELA